MSGRYRTLFTGTLEQQSGLSVGGADPESFFVDSPLCRDGKERLILRGQSLAGALIATARKLGPVPEDVSLRLFGGGKPKPSRWQVFSSHPDGDDEPQVEFRQHVGIRQDTGAAAKGVFYDVEVLPCGTRWPFLMEVNTRGDGGECAERLAAAALLEWTRGRCFLGRDVARGLGWLRLTGLQARRLGSEHARVWPDSRKAKPLDVVNAITVTPVEAKEFAEEFKPLPISKQWRYLDISGTVSAGLHKVGSNADEYGLDAISIGAHAAMGALAEWNDHYLRCKDRDEISIKDEFSPDMALVMTRRSGGDVVPVIPGSSLRGPLRHAFSRALRQLNHEVRDHNAPDSNGAKEKRRYNDAAAPLFGTVDHSARLLVRDANLVGNAWRAALLEHHAEDEFAGSVYGAGKFNRTVLVEGTFAWRMVVEYRERSRNVVNHYRKEILETFSNFADAGQLALGGAKWRSAGWPKWSITGTRLAFAGEQGGDLQTGGAGAGMAPDHGTQESDRS